MSEFFRDVKKTASCTNCTHFTAGKCNVVMWIDGRHQTPEPTEPGGYCYLWEGRDDREDMPD